MKILTICGSLRRDSSNALILSEAERVLHGMGHTFIRFDLARLPYFDADRQYDDTPSPVLEMRQTAGDSDLILISTPEYAHGIPGILKNGLEWLFCELTNKKRVVLVIGAAQGQWVKAHLLDVLPTMDFVLPEEDIFMIQGLRAKIQASGITDPDLQSKFVEFLQQAVR